MYINFNLIIFFFFELPLTLQMKLYKLLFDGSEIGFQIFNFNFLLSRLFYLYFF